MILLYFLKNSISLQTKISSLDEMQVINKGYYTEKAKYTTGNVSTVKSKDIQKQPVNNPFLELVGKVLGLFITQRSGIANSGIVVRIEGRNSIEKSTLAIIYYRRSTLYTRQQIILS